MKISRRAAAITPFYALEFGKRAAALEAQGHHIIKLSIGEPDFGAPPDVLGAAREAADGRSLGYTDALGLPQLREAIAHFYSTHFRCDVSPDQVAVTSGASAALLLCCAALVDPGDEILVGDPSYPCNRRFAESFGARVKLIGTGPESRFALTAADVEAAWTPATSGVMVATPSNPTGTSIPPGELAAISSLAEARNAWRIVDEIYLGLSDPDPQGGGPRSILATDPGAVVINSFSKYFGMTGWRLGWCVVPADLLEALERLAQNFYICPPAPAQMAAMACFTPGSLRVAADRHAELIRRRELVLRGLADIGLAVPVTPDGAFYVYVDVSATGLTSTEFCDRALEEAHVSLTPGMDFGDIDAHRYLRLSYAAGTAELTEGIERLRRFVDSLHH